jgi:ABC-type amino acid transport substrate-binding protein
VSRHGVAAAWVAVAVVLAVTTRAYAESSLDDIRARGVLRVGVKTDAPPFGSRDANGRPIGFEIDLARYLARVLFDDERRARFVPVTTATRFAELHAGCVDLLIATVTATEERRQLAELSEPYFVSASLVLVPAGSGVSGLGDLAARRVAVVRGSVQERDVAERQPHALLTTVASVAEGAQAVKRGHVDAFVYDDVTLLTLAQHDPALRVTGGPLAPRGYVAAARKGDAGLIRWLDGWLARMRRDGSYVEIWRRHFRAFEGRLVGS